MLFRPVEGMREMMTRFVANMNERSATSEGTGILVARTWEIRSACIILYTAAFASLVLSSWPAGEMIDVNQR
ncbi:Copper binding periplasmic protein CusF [Anopheles sinensis]|uniref:Copper binding periplasmic protein CusF n=1 Tax=Anopheles sinensis TaxID=74873 RepID=A0A084VK59_ANOSI|nr:Copper binding periplasmic protein CusF [Anopheles sinensis]